MSLHTQSLSNAVTRLEEGLADYQQDTTKSLMRDGVIHRFKLTYELSHKTLKRYLKTVSASTGEFDTMAFPDLIRTANRMGLLLSDWPKWREFREMRNKTSHTYDEAIALEVMTGIPEFLEEARYLTNQLEQRSAS